MTFNAARSDDASLSRWVAANVLAADAVLLRAIELRAAATAAAEKYPGHPAYVDSCVRRANYAWQAGKVMAGQYRTVRTDALEAFMRLDAPRGGSVAKEVRADNRTAGLDRADG